VRRYRRIVRTLGAAVLARKRRDRSPPSSSIIPPPAATVYLWFIIIITIMVRWRVIGSEINYLSRRRYRKSWRRRIKIFWQCVVVARAGRGERRSRVRNIRRRGVDGAFYNRMLVAGTREVVVRSRFGSRALVGGGDNDGATAATRGGSIVRVWVMCWCVCVQSVSSAPAVTRRTSGGGPKGFGGREEEK